MSGWNLSIASDKELIGNSDAGGQYNITLTNTIFSEQPASSLPSLWFTTDNLNGNDNEITLRNLVLYNINPVDVRPGSDPIVIDNEMNSNPQFADPSNGDFTIGNSTYLAAGDSNSVIGARYWHPDFVDEYSDIPKNNNGFLDSIYIDGKPLKIFNSSTTKYLIKLPAETTEIPDIVCYTSDKNATYTITNATDLAGDETERQAAITVLAEDQITSKVYIIEFYVSSLDASLSSITVENEILNDFSSEIFSYIFEVPASTIAIPEVSYTLSHDSATAEIIPATSLTNEIDDRITTIKVTAEDTSYISEYKILFVVLPSSISSTLLDYQWYYPTITGSSIFIKNSDDIILSIDIISSSGRQISSIKIQKTDIQKIDISNLDDGIYILRAITDKNIFYGRFVKE
jgi:hypothetical protein